MSIDNLTLGEIKQIATMFGDNQAKRQHPMVGKYVILRTQNAGIHAGELISQYGDEAILKNSRRLWKWKTPHGIALSGVSQHGIVADESKIDTLVPEIAITGVIETIPCSDQARQTISDAKEYQP